MDLRDEITQTIRDQSILGFNFVRLTKWEDILNRLGNRFLRNGSGDLDSIWLWERFRDPITSKQPEDPLVWLRENLEPTVEYWFIATDEDGKYWVAEATGDSIIRVIEEMYCFEYYVADRGMNWIVCENHHNVFIHCS